MPRFGPVSIWADGDPAVARFNDLVSLRPPEATETPAPVVETAAAPLSRRDRIVSLLARVRAGDLSAVENLRREMHDGD